MDHKLAPTRILSTSIAAIFGVAGFVSQNAHAQSTGVFSTSGSLGTTDQTANVGLSTTKTYLEAIDLGDTTNTTVNGVIFTGSGSSTTPSGTGWALTGTANLYGGGGTLPGGVLGGLTNKFVYGGNPATLTLTGLTVGQTYVITFYDRSWETAGQRVQTITASGASSATTVFDENIGASGQGQLNLLRYTFQASSATQTLTIAPQIATNTMHLYAFTNEQTFNNAWTGGADWSTATWSAGQPNGAGTNASFGAQSAPTTINLGTAQTVGHVQFDGTNAWTLSGTNTLTLQADVGGVSVLSSLAGSHTISTPVTLASDAVKLGGGNLSLTGTVSGTKGLIVNGGTLTLGAVNSYSGGTTVNDGGTLRLGTAGALGATNGTLTVNTGGLVDINGTSQSVGNFNGTGTIANNASGTNSVLTVGTDNTGGSTFAGVLADHTTGTGTLALTKVGTGTMTLSGANSYTGLTTISEGRLQLNGSAAGGTLTTSGINIGATGSLGFTSGVGSTLTLKAGSTVTLGGGTIALDLASATTSDKITADTFALTANSAVAFTPITGLSFGSTYTLATYNTLSNPGSFTLTGTTVGRLSLNPVIGANAITVTPTLDSATWNNASGGTWSAGPWTNYTPTAAGDSAVFGSALTANGTVTVDSARTVGYLTFNNGAASYTLGSSGSSNLTLNNGTSPAMVDVKAGSHTIAENVALASDVFATTDANTTLMVKGVVSGTKSVTKFGAGTLVLTNTNTYSGGTTVSEGTLQLGDGTANGSVTGNITDNATLAFNNGAAQTFAGIISGTGAVTKTGAGTLNITGANTFTGGLTISAGTVDIGGNSTTGSVTGTIVNNSTLRFSHTNAFTINNVVNGSGNTIVSGGVSAVTATTLSPTASINTPTLTIGDTGTTQGWLTFGAPNQMNGTTGVVLNITAHASNSRINLNGFDQTVAGLTGTGIVQNAESGTPAAATFTINVPGTNSYSWTGLIRNQAGGALGVTKTGTGEQVMNFSITNPTYTGATTVNQGRLTFGSTIAAPTWSTSGINVAAGAEVGLTGAGSGVVSWSEGVPITGAGSLVRTGVDTNTVTITNTTNSFTGYTKLSGTGTLAVAALANIGTDSPIGRGDGTSAATNAASLVLDGGTLRYTGAAVNSNRLFTLTQNGGTIESAGVGAVNFNNSGALATSGSGARTLILTGTNTGSNNTLAGALGDGTGGATSITKNQAGTWVLTGANTYTGATTVNAGRLQFEGSAASGTRATSNLAVNAGATFGFTAGTGSTLALANTLTLGGGTIVLDLGSAAGSDKITANTLALTGNTAISFNQIGGYDVGSTYTLASYNTLSNAGNFTLSGFSAGRLSLTPVIGANAITMTPVLDNAVWNRTTGGTWSTGPWTNYTPNAVGDAALFGPALAANGTVTVDSPETVGYLTFNNAAASYTIGTAGSANLTLANSGTAAAQIFVNAGNHTIAENTTLASDVMIFTSAATSLTFSGALTGQANSVTKSGPGTLTLSGTSDFGVSAGKGLNIDQGKVILGSTTALPATGGLNINNATLDLNANDATTGLLAGSGGTITDNATAPGTTTFTINQAGTSVFGGALADGAARKLAIVKSGAGSLTLSGANTFSGGLTITNGSVTAASGLGVAIPGNVTLGDGSNSVWLISGAISQQFGPNTVVTFANGGKDAKLALRGTNQTLAGIDSSMAQSLAIIQNDETTAPGYTTAPGAVTLTLNTTTDHSYYGIIRNQAGGALSITKEGPGTQELINNPNTQGLTYTGATTINGGKLVLNLSGTTSSAFASNITVNGSGTLGLDGFWTLAKPVNGTGSVVKQGNGIVTVSSALTHTGNTIIAAGTLALTGSISGSASIDVQSGATFDVSGVAGGFTLGATQTLKGEGNVLGAATINGTLSPGSGIGTLTTDALTLGDGSVFALEINTSSATGLAGVSDLAAVNGAFSLSTGVAPTLMLSDLGSNVTLAVGTKFTFITYAGAWNGGLFKVGGQTIADEGIFTFGANQYRLDYNNGGNSVALIAVPEPGTGAVAIAGLGALLGMRRRRKA